MRTISVLLTATLVFAVGLLALPPVDHIGPKSATGAKTVDNDAYVDANRILMFITNHGNFGRDLAYVFGYDYGAFFPYIGDTSLISSGAMKTSPLYAAGLWLGGKVNDQIRVTIAAYSDEYVPGKMNGDPPGSPQYRVFRIYADSAVSNPTADYLEWPVADGAPVDGLGRPVIIGDQTLWSVFNDADLSQHNNDAGSTEPLGVEVQQTVWAVAQGGTDTIPSTNPLHVNHLGDSPLSVIAYAVDAVAITGDDYLVEVVPDAQFGHIWRLKNLTTSQIVLDNQTDFSGMLSDVIEGLQVAVIAPPGEWTYASAVPTNWSPVAVTENGYSGGRWFTGSQSGGELFYGGVFMEPHFWGLTSVFPADIEPVELRFRPMTSYTDLNGNSRYDIGEPYVVDEPTLTQNAFMYSSLTGDSYEGFSPVPFTAWDISDPYNPRQVNVVIRDRDQNDQWDLHYQFSPPDDLLPNSGDLRNNFIWILNTDYDPTGTRYGDGTGGTIDFWSYEDGNGIWDAMWMFWFAPRLNYGMLAEQATFSVNPRIVYTESFTDNFTFTSSPPQVITCGREDLIIYMQYKLYNKSVERIDSCYIALWSDPDLGGASDDLFGCDTLSDLFFCYNGTDNDGQYGSHPPAIGFKFLYGPVIPSPNDTAFFAGTLMPGRKNMDMSSFQVCGNGTDPQSYLESFNYIRGLARDGSPLPNGTHYAFPGDPVTGDGDLDSAPADKRMMGVCGPFTFNPGDSQYVLVKMAVGQGHDRLASITKLKEILDAPPHLGTLDLMAIVRPEPQYYYFQNAGDPTMDTIFLGRVGGDPVGYINYSSLRVNGDIAPASVSLLPGYPGFRGEVLRMIFSAQPFVAGYGPLWDTTVQPFAVTGSFSDGAPFTASGTVLMIGNGCGNANGDNTINVGDAVFLIGYIFRGGPAPNPLAAGDANCDGPINVGDAVYLISYIFRGGPAPCCP